MLVPLALSFVAACDVGSVAPNGGDDVSDVDGSVPPPIDAAIPTFAVGVEPAVAQTTLGTETTFTVTLAPSHFNGAVDLTATGAPTGWLVAVSPSSVTLTDGVSATATVTVRVPSNGAPAPTGQALTITATAPVYTAGAAATLTVANDYLISVGAVGGNTHWGAMNGGTIRIKAGTRLRIRNDDTITHRIHTGGGVGGFDHQPTPGTLAGGTLDVMPTSGSDTFYCHIHGEGTGSVNLVIE
ncbi:MAG: hypothetical protein IPL61_11255 [Myxococcales bacterium]|nr:hypothetical protein [Myxococcales bacterium]